MSGVRENIELTALMGPLEYVWYTSMRGGAPAGAGASTRAAAASPKIIREVRTVPILSENFSPHTTSTGRSTAWSRRTASARPDGRPAQAATRSHGPCVWNTPAWPGSQAPTDGIIFRSFHDH